MKTKRKTMLPNGDTADIVEQDKQQETQASKDQFDFNFSGKPFSINKDSFTVAGTKIDKEDVIIVLMIINLVMLWK